MIQRYCDLMIEFLLIVCRNQRAKPIVIDPGLYLTKKSDLFWITQRRSVPTAFKLFTGDTSFDPLPFFEIVCCVLFIEHYSLQNSR